MSLLPIDPADFPDVPTRKAFIAIDLQNDFLTADGALPVTQPDGMIDKIVRLAEAVRASGYGEVIWVRSQFDTSRPAGEQQIMSAETLQMPVRSSSSATLRSPTVAEAADGDSEAFLSVVEGITKPVCVRKGTRGAEFLAAIAAAKGPKDYAMTKSHYSAFQSGQLLNLLRRQFATELIICGSLSNVSVYATALAASSHGLDITIVEDCCGYRSEMRHMNAARKLMDQTGCEFTNAADVIKTLRPRSPLPTTPPKGRSEPPGPPQVPPEIIAAAVAENRNKGIPVRPKPASPLIPNPSRSAAKKGTSETRTAAKRGAEEVEVEGEEDEEEEEEEEQAAAAEPVPLPPPSPPPDGLLLSMEKLKLSTDFSETADATATSGDTVTAVLECEDDSPQTWEHVVAWDVCGSGRHPRAMSPHPKDMGA